MPFGYQTQSGRTYRLDSKLGPSVWAGIKYPHCVQTWNIHKRQTWSRSSARYTSSLCEPKQASMPASSGHWLTIFWMCKLEMKRCMYQDERMKIREQREDIPP